MKKLIFIFSFLFCANVFAQNKTISLPTEEIMAEIMLKNNVPAVSIGIIENNNVKTTKVFGELKKGVPAPQNAIFQVASLTKPITEMTVLRLVSQGKWSLDEPLYKYWIDPDVAADSNHKLLTTRHVISHQTGFMNWRWLHKTGKLTFDFKPGTHTGYSGEGLEYLKKALQNKFKKPLEEIVKTELFDKVGMPDTRFYWDTTMTEARFAVAHTKEGKPIEIRKNKEASAADLLMTTVQDYTKFGASVLNKNGFSKQIWQEMVTKQAPEQNSKFGLGWEIFDELPNKEFALIHSGSDPGVRTIIVLLPVSKRGLVIFTNGDNGMNIVMEIIKNHLDIGEELIKKGN